MFQVPNLYDAAVAVVQEAGLSLSLKATAS